MIRQLSGPGLVLAVVLALCAAPVSAQTNTYLFSLMPVGGGDNGYSITLQKWDGAADSPGSVFRISKIIATPSPSPGAPAESGFSVEASFFGQLGCFGGTVAIAGLSSIAGVTVNTGSGTNPDGLTDNWMLSTYNGAGVKHGLFTSPLDSADNILKKGRTNMFLQGDSGRIETAGLVASARITVHGLNGTDYEGCVDLSAVNVPEASSLMLLASGLIPLGMVLRRRSRARV